MPATIDYSYLHPRRAERTAPARGLASAAAATCGSGRQTNLARCEASVYWLYLRLYIAQYGAVTAQYKEGSVRQRSRG